MTDLVHITDCGLPGITRIPYGLHACHFYRSGEALAEALVPYFVAGLRNNERCLWITAEPLGTKEAVALLRAEWRGVDEALASGALSVLDYSDWYLRASESRGKGVLDAWLEEEQRALDAGYRGLRITGNTSFLHAADWRSFMDYERAVTAGFVGRRIVALCSYALARCSPAQVKDAMQTHNCTFDRADAVWQVLGAHPDASL